MNPRANNAATDRARVVIDACLAMGFALAGIAPAEATARRAEFLAWLAAGSHGDMDYLAEMVEERLDPRVLLPAARAVIVVADQYAERGVGEAGEAGGATLSAAAPMGTIAKYARGRDYHAVIRRRLHALCDRLRQIHPDQEFRAFVDTGPALEREHAARAGLGFIGKHTLLINPRLGSYLLLGGVATTLELAPAHSALGTQHSALPSPCGTCTRCIDACPTRAIAPYRVEATRCISYLTLEHRGLIDPSLHTGIGDRVLGCDVCQDVCPFNHAHEDEGHPRVNPAYTDEADVRSGLPLLEVLGWTEPDRSRVLSGSAAKRANLSMIRRNALVAAANANEPSLWPVIRRIAADASEDALVRETAQQVLAGRAG